MNIKIRRAVENDLEELTKLVRDSRIKEHFKNALRDYLIYSLKFQVF